MLKYLSTVYDPETYRKVKEVFTFYHDLAAAKNDDNCSTDVKMYGVDIDAVRKGKSLEEIKEFPTMVYINKVGNNISYVVKPMVDMG